MTYPIDLFSIFEQAAGRPMLQSESDDLRRLRATMPPSLAESPSYTYNLALTYHLAQQLRDTVDDVSRTIRNDSQRQSKVVVAEMVENAVRRIHASSPASQAAQYRALTAGALVLIMATCIASAAILTAVSKGWIAPSWLTEEASAKVHFADVLEERLGSGKVDWTMRAGEPDKSLLDIVQYVEKRGTPDDPFQQLSALKQCKGSGQVSRRHRGVTTCSFQVIVR